MGRSQSYIVVAAMVIVLLIVLAAAAQTTPPFSPQTGPGAQVQAADPIAETQLADIRGPIRLSDAWPWWVWALAASVPALCLLAYWLIRRRNRRQPVVPPRPAHEMAFSQLNAARKYMQFETSARFCRLVSHALRQYLARRFENSALGHTTDECLAALPATRDPQLRPFIPAIGRLLHACDLAKFARQRYPRPELEQIMDQDWQIVDQTHGSPQPSDTENKTPHAALPALTAESGGAR